MKKIEISKKIFFYLFKSNSYICLEINYSLKKEEIK
jgi:hypothetical protein